ncbi:IS4 family transposase [Alicyclobacillus acidoterrestris]|uniref:IS4 family transposase n=1 Tax=Alicyclobacillus TaxID=29330 RepID=UPI001A8F9BE7|nr:transposase [Alicyclobacillus suci]
MVRESHGHDQLQSMITRFFHEHRIASLLKSSNIKKETGIPVIHIFRFLFQIVFLGRNVSRLLNDASTDFEKDTVYRFLNSPRHNWRKFLLSLAVAVVQRFSKLTSDDRADVLIVDDSLYDRSRSKKVELLAKVFDHTTHQFVRGFRMLTLGWSDGNSFVPVAFSLLSSENERNRLCGMSESIDKRTTGYKRRRESTMKATDVMFELLSQAQSAGVKAKYLLFDSWFAYPSVILRVITGHAMNVICMLKAMPHVYYEFEGRRVTLNQLYSQVRKRRGRAKILTSVAVIIGKDEKGRPVPAKIVFVRNRHKSRDWLALLSTDTSLPDDEIVRVYGKRWNVETFFKMTKSYLRLAKEFQGRSYDFMVAHTTIVFTRYIMLAVLSREEADPRTLGKLFYDCCDELADIRFIEVLRVLLSLLRQALQEFVDQDPILIDRVVGLFIDRLPAPLKAKLAA